MTTEQAIRPPLPTPRGEEALYFDALREHRLVYQACADCDAVIFPLRTVCPTCSSLALELRDSAGRGVVHSFTTHQRAMHPYFADRVPYTVVLVDLEEGFRMMSDITHCAPDDVHVGLPVASWFDDIDDEVTLIRFTPADAAQRSGK